MRKVEFGDGVTLYLGDCLALWPEIGRVDHVVSDPPYEAVMHEHKKAAARRIRTDGRDELKSLDFAPIDEIRQKVADLCAEYCDGWSLLFCAPEGVARWADAINATSAKYKRACVWVKPDSTPQLNGMGPAMGAENFVASWCGKGHSRWNAGGKRGVYTHLTNPSNRDGRHPTEKPLALMSELIVDFTSPNQLIFDPFMGSGTTGVACARTGRRFVGIEMKPEYFEIACDRISDEMKRPILDLGPVSAKKSQMQLFGNP